MILFRLSVEMALVYALLAVYPCLPAATLEKHIIDGSDAPAGVYPWMVSLQVLEDAAPTDGESHLCGGLLIHPRWVLTCGHCTNRYPVATMYVATGSYRLSQANIRREIVAVYPYYNNFPGLIQHDDIALLELAAPIDDVPPVRLRRPEAGILPRGTPLRALGWGVIDLENPELQTDILQQTDYQMAVMDELPLHPEDPGYLDFLDPLHWVTALPERTSSRINSGDSGGPLLWNGPQGWELIGLNAMTVGEWDFFVNVSHFLPWMESVTGESLALWQTYYQIIAESADVDNDGWSNREEFFFGMHPLSVDQPVAGLSLPSGHWRHPFPSTLAGQWITYQYSENLRNWSGNTVPGWLFTRSSAEGLSIPASPSGTQFFQWKSASPPTQRRLVQDELGWGDSRTIGGSGATDYWFALPAYPTGLDLHLYVGWTGRPTAPAWSLIRLRDLAPVLSFGSQQSALPRTFRVEADERYVLQVLRETNDALPFLLVCQPAEGGRQKLLSGQTWYGNLNATALRYPSPGHACQAYLFAATSNSDWRIKIESSQFDTVAWLLDPVTGERRGFCDAVVHTPEDFPLRLSPGKNLEIRVSSWKPGESGDYSISVAPITFSHEYSLLKDRDSYFAISADTAEVIEDSLYQRLPISFLTPQILVRLNSAQDNYSVYLVDETIFAPLDFDEGRHSGSATVYGEMTTGHEYALLVIVPTTVAPLYYRVLATDGLEMEEFPEPSAMRRPTRANQLWQSYVAHETAKSGKPSAVGGSGPNHHQALTKQPGGPAFDDDLQ